MTSAELTTGAATAVTPSRVLRSEWVKLTTLRSMSFMLAAAVVAMVGLSVLVSLITVHDWATMSPADRATMQVSSRVLVGRLLAQLFVGVIGVTVISGEYTTGMIRATLAAVPRRPLVLAAKLLVPAAVVLVAMTIASFASFYAGNAILAEHWDFHLSDPGVLRAVIMNGVTLTAVCLLGTALGFILRHTAAAIATLFAVLMVLPILAEFSPEVAQYLPTFTILSLVTPLTGSHMLTPLPAFLLLCAYVAAAVAGAAVTLNRKDA